jgi:uncharacterized protein (TIGR02145 family)
VTIPALTSISVSAITESTASGGGNITAGGGGAITARGVCWGTAANPTTGGSKTSNGTGTGSFTSAITGLNPGTTYHVRAYASNSAGTGYGNDLSFTTETAPATIATTAVTSPTATTASSGGTITADGGAAITARGVCWGTAANPVIASNNYTSDGTGTGTFTSSITGLTPGVTYHVRAYSTNSAGTSYGNDATFATPAILAALTTAIISSPTATSAASGGTITSDGGAAVTARGVCWNTSAGPTTANTKSSDATGTGTFTSSITGLSPVTTYYVRAYATNSAGTSYGDELSFTTPPAVPSLVTARMELVTTTSALAGGNVILDGGAAVTNRGVCFNTTGSPSTADFKTSLGAGAAIFISDLSGLTAGTTYYVRAYATNSAGTGYGNSISFVTVPTSVSDADGNVYNIALIDTQVWMKENLKTTKLNDGTAIPNITDATWATVTTPAMGWYNNNEATYKDVYGGYYNFYTVSTGKLCPTGWRVPNDHDWTALFTFLGGTNAAGGKMKEAGLTHWNSPNTGATNSSGFSGLPGGYRFPGDGSYGGLTQIANWWTTTQQDPNMGFHKQLQWDTPVIGQAGGVKTWGRNVRCVK